MNKYAIGIVGARGYSGLDLSRILLAHPNAELTTVYSTDSNKGFALSDYLPETSAKFVKTLPLSDLEKTASSLHTVFLATPAEASMELAPKLIAMGVNVIDLSGAFRLSKDLYPEWYGFTHTETSLLATAHYGLVPFAKPFAKTGATLVANPGCYVTSVLMALIPLLKDGVIDPSTVVIDAKSGTSGAGKKASEGLLFTEVDGECLPYKIAKHQHFPEICHYAKFLGTSANTQFDPMFSTTLLPVRRGIISSIFVKLKNGKTASDVSGAYAKAFEGYPLVRFGASTDPQALSLKRVVGSARTHIRFTVDGEKLYLNSLIDNLMKGAASQAVENFNLLVGLPPETALTHLEGTL